MAELLSNLFLAVGLLCVVGGTWVGWLEYRRARTWRLAEGKVFQLVEVRDDDGEGTAFFPMVEFRGPSGSAVTFRSRTGRYPPQYAVGATVRVCYPAENPQAAQIIGERIWAAVLLGIVGLMSLAGSVLLTRL